MAIDPNNLAATAHLTFDDEFNSLSLWNGSSGTWATTFWYQDAKGNGGTLASNGEQEWYINSNYGPTSGVKPWTVNNGVLTLTASPASASASPLINGYGYTSGELNTYHSFSQTYGYFEMRAKLPAGQGFWPAFWLLPENGAWPPELDVVETLGQNPSGLVTTVHSDAGGTYSKNGLWTQVADTSAGYHTFGVDWEPDYITWYFDGQAVHKTATPADLNVPMYMIANLAAGGYWPGAVTPGSSAQMNIDYIRAYASGAGASTATNSAAAPTQAPIAGHHTVVTHDPLNIDHTGLDGVVFRNAATGDLGYMTANPSGGETWHASGATSTAFASMGVGDFNGDGLSGVALRNTATGEWGYMALTPGGGETWHDIGSTSLAYSAVGTGDFAGDGSWAVAFVNSATGDFGYMSVTASGGEQWTDVGQTSTAYTAYGAGDFLGHGQTGELFRNNATGDMGFMTASPGGGEAWHAIGPTGTGYAVIGLGDFDGSGQTEVAFRNTSTGEWGYMTANASGSGETWRDVGPSSLGYAALKVGDFDHSGHADVAFRNAATGDWGYMSPNAGGGETWHHVGSASLDYYAI